MKRICYRKSLKNIKALSTVVTTLIILVISVLLATVVTYFAINVVSTRVQEESLHITKHHIWHTGAITSAGNSSCASVMIINTGGRDIVLDKISVRGQECYWNQSGPPVRCVYFCRTTSTIAEDMPFPTGLMKYGGTFDSNVTIGSTNYTFTVATNDLILKSGWTLLIYVINPDSISLNDIGLTIGLTIHTAQAMYYRETNVEAYFTT
jgi:hypothetical protein